MSVRPYSFIELLKKVSSFAISASDLCSILQNAPLLEKVELLKMSLTVVDPHELLALPHLKALSMVEVSPAYQKYLLPCLILSPQCKLTIGDVEERHDHRRLLHDLTMNRLAPITFTSVELHPHSIGYEESMNGARCCLRVKLSNRTRWNRGFVDPTQSLDLSQVKTLHFYHAQSYVNNEGGSGNYGNINATVSCEEDAKGEKDVLFVLSAVAPSIRTLVFHQPGIPICGNARYWLEHVVLENCPLLETIVFEDIDLMPNTPNYSAAVEVLSQFVEKRRKQGIKPPRIQLRGCRVDMAKLKEFSDVAVLEVIHSKYFAPGLTRRPLYSPFLAV